MGETLGASVKLCVRKIFPDVNMLDAELPSLKNTEKSALSRPVLTAHPVSVHNGPDPRVRGDTELIISKSIPDQLNELPGAINRPKKLIV